MPHYTVAHSPDADDIFMYYAVKFGWVKKNDITFENEALDIETLNKKALKSEYDICAISFALYPHIRDEYALLNTAASFGEGYGPKLIKKKNKSLKKNFKVALSGEYTTNAMLFRIKYPDAKISYMNFLEIEKAVLDGTVDAGVLIHESILTYSNELETEAEIFDIWLDLAGENLPLPLGGMALRRSIPLNRAIECQEILTDAIKIGINHKELLSKMLIERDLIRVNEEDLKKYLNLYANERSLKFDEMAIRGLDKLFEIGFRAKFYPDLIKTADYLIPTEYKNLRNS
ncbi:MAG: 1,4-dihydroxy-6-naphthoate synthase [Campylobacterota bacterium]|nr:1,4-dihydroxy-6-naphthoate synthase [Campylobacterota bacterium]